MEVMIPQQDFDFTTTSALSSPYSSTPQTPRRFGDYFYSAPTSPSRMSDLYRAFDDEFHGEVYGSTSPNTIPYGWESNPGTKIADKVDFAFEFSQDLERTSVSADELFDGGKIKPLEPQPRLEKVNRTSYLESPIRSPRSPNKAQKKTAKERGRERTSTNSAASASFSGSSSGRRAARSLSPLRGSQYPWEEERQSEQQRPKEKAALSKPSSNSSSSTKGSSSSSRKWRLRDLLLFRSASEGRATDKDPLRKYYSALHGKKQHHEQKAEPKIRPTESFGSGARRKSAAAVSAHERHYTANKAASEGLKKKTFLPYNQGILGRLAFNPAVHALSNGFGSFTRS